MAKKTVKKSPLNYWVLLLALALAAILVYARYQITQPLQNLPSIQPSPQFKTFRSSDVMDFTIRVPSSYTATENLGSTKIISPEKLEILIGMNSTNFSNVKDFYDSSPNKYNNRVKEKLILEINGLESISSTFEDHKTYFIYVNNQVYLLSTFSKQLYEVLDQIAQSFKYTPN